MKYFLAYTYSIVLLALSSYSLGNEAKILNGASTYTELNLSQYIGGLYLEQKSQDIQYILLPDTAKRMQLVITRKTWSKRAWKRHWRNRIAVSNPSSSSNKGVIAALSKFTTMLKGPLVRGDEVSIDYSSGFTTVRLNKEVVLKQEGTNMFNYLILTWIGDVPPTTPFRKAILNGETDRLWTANKKALEDYQVPYNRQNLYSTWVQNESAAKAQELAKIKAKEEALQAKIAAEKARQQKTKQARLAKTQKTNKNQKQDKQKGTSAQTQAENKQNIQAYDEALIQWQVQRYINTHVEYPYWSKKFGEEGLVEVTFEVNPKREISITKHSTDTDAMLVEEVENVLRKSMSNITLPNTFKNKPWQMTARYLFTLEGETLSKALPPVKPNPLSRSPLSQTERNTLLETYQQSIIAAIKEDVVYPEIAKISRQRGLVKAEVMIDRWGEVKQIDFAKKNNRVNHINNAITQAVESKAPFKIIPPELELDSVLIKVEHKFR